MQGGPVLDTKDGGGRRKVGEGVQRPYCEAELPFFCLTVLQPLPGEDQGDEDRHFPIPTLASLVPVLGWVQGGLQTPMS